MFRALLHAEVRKRAMKAIPSRGPEEVASLPPGRVRLSQCVSVRFAASSSGQSMIVWLSAVIRARSGVQRSARNRHPQSHLRVNRHDPGQHERTSQRACERGVSWQSLADVGWDRSERWESNLSRTERSCLIRKTWRSDRGVACDRRVNRQDRWKAHILSTPRTLGARPQLTRCFRS